MKIKSALIYPARRVEDWLAKLYVRFSQKCVESPHYKAAMARDVTNRRWRALMEERHRRAAASTYDYIDENLGGVIYSTNRKALWTQVTEQLAEGSILQFGVFTGGSINQLADILPTRTLHGFDSFEGLAENWTYLPKGAFDLKGRLPKVRDNVILHKGWFNVTLPSFLADNDEKVAFLDIDCDTYDSAACVLRLLKDRIQTGTIIHFDELIGYYGWQHGEYKAMQEFITETGFKIEFLYYGLTYVGCRVLGQE
jgi:hypothetical protein